LTKNDIKYYNYVNNHPFDNRKYPQYTFTINHYTVSLKIITTHPMVTVYRVTAGVK
jgi:hypothetical protein